MMGCLFVVPQMDAPYILTDIANNPYIHSFKCYLILMRATANFPPGFLLGNTSRAIRNYPGSAMSTRNGPLVGRRMPNHGSISYKSHNPLDNHSFHVDFQFLRSILQCSVMSMVHGKPTIDLTLNPNP